MIDDSKTLKFEQDSPPQHAPFTWKAFPLETLMRFKLEIEALLPSTKLQDVDVEAELVTQLRMAQAFQAKVLDDPENLIPVNQAAQAINSVSGIIAKLSTLQIDLAASEQLKRMERAFIKAVEGLPTEAVEKFFERYEHIAREEGVVQGNDAIAKKEQLGDAE